MSQADRVQALEYRRAALDRVADAQILHDADQFGSACWVAGVGVECMLRAYTYLRTNEIPTGHNLAELRTYSRFVDRVPHRHRERIGVSLGEMISGWRHRFRYEPESRIRARIGSSERATRRSSRTIVNAAWDIVSMGDRRWP